MGLFSVWHVSSYVSIVVVISNISETFTHLYTSWLLGITLLTFGDL